MKREPRLLDEALHSTPVVFFEPHALDTITTLTISGLFFYRFNDTPDTLQTTVSARNATACEMEWTMDLLRCPDITADDWTRRPWRTEWNGGEGSGRTLRRLDEDFGR